MSGSAVVTTTIKLQGEDRASAEIDKAKKAVDGTAKSLEEAASKSDVLQGAFNKAFSGDILGAVKSMGGLLGSGTGLAGTLATAGAAAGLVAIGVAGIALETAKWSIQLEKVRAATEHALGPEGLERVEAIAAIAGGAAEDYGKLAAKLKLMGIDAHITADELGQLRSRASSVGLDGTEAIEAFGDAIESGKTKALKQFGVFVDSEAAIQKYSKAHLISADAMTVADKQAALLAAITADLDRKITKGSSTAKEQGLAISHLSNTWNHLKMEFSGVVTGPLTPLIDGIAQVADVSIRLGRVIVALMDIGLRPFITLIKVEIDAMVGLAAAADAVIHRDFKGAAEIAKTVGSDIKKHVVDDNVDSLKRLGAAFQDAVSPKNPIKVPAVLDIKGDKDNKGYESDGPSPEVLDKERMRRIEKAQKDKESAHAKALAAGMKHAEDLKRLAEQEAKNAQHWIDERVKHEKEDTDALDRIREDSEKKFLNLTAKAANDPAAKAKIRLLELEAQRVKDLAKIRDATSASEKDQARAVLAVERAAAAEKAQIAKDEADESSKASAQKMDDAFRIAGAVKGALADIGVSKRIMAVFDGALETAEAIKSAASYDYVGAAQHALAAAAFAAAAMQSGSGGGSSGGSYAPAMASAGGGGGSSSGKGGNVYNYHFSRGFIFGSTQQLAKDMTDVTKTLAPTGYASARGA